MGTDRKQLGYVIVVKPYRKHGNGAKGGGRLGSTGKRCELFKIDQVTSERESIAKTEGPTAKAALKELRASVRVIPTYVTVQNNGETFF